MRLPYATDCGHGARAALGLIVLREDQTMEAECHQMLNLPGIALHCARIPCAAEISPEHLAAMQQDLAQAAARLPSANFAAIGFGCTSGSCVMGEREVARLVQTAHPQAQVSNPLLAVKTALRALNIKRLALVAPYTPEVSAGLCQALEAEGVSIVNSGSFEQADDRHVARITPQSCLDAVLAVGEGAACEGVFLSCTNLRALGIIEQAEARLGVPVITSNQALVWHLLRLAGVEDGVTGAGRLLQTGT